MRVLDASFMWSQRSAYEWFRVASVDFAESVFYNGFAALCARQRRLQASNRGKWAHRLQFFDTNASTSRQGLTTPTMTRKDRVSLSSKPVWYCGFFHVDCCGCNMRWIYGWINECHHRWQPFIFNLRWPECYYVAGNAAEHGAAAPSATKMIWSILSASPLDPVSKSQCSSCVYLSPLGEFWITMTRTWLSKALTPFL